MKRFNSLRGMEVASVLGLTVLAFGGTTAQACDKAPQQEYTWVTTYECVTTWETKCEPYTKTVTKYDHCGKPYQATVTCYREVKVPVTKKVAVQKKVPVAGGYKPAGAAGNGAANNNRAANNNSNLGSNNSNLGLPTRR